MSKVVEVEKELTVRVIVNLCTNHFTELNSGIPENFRIVFARHVDRQEPCDVENCHNTADWLTDIQFKARKVRY
jgi:hypothetical protein